MTNFNERTNTLPYKNISLTLYSRKGWCWLCVRGELETGTDCHILTQSSSDHSSTSFLSWLGCSTVGHWGPKPSVCKPILMLATCPPIDSNCNWLQLTNWLELTQAVCGTWLYNCFSSTCFLWTYASAPHSTTSTGQGDIPISSTGCTCFAVLPLIYAGASLDWWFGRGSICYKIPEEGRGTYRPKRCANINKDEDNSPKNLDDKNHQALSQKFRQRIICLFEFHGISTTMGYSMPNPVNIYELYMICNHFLYELTFSS